MAKKHLTLEQVFELAQQLTEPPVVKPNDLTIEHYAQHTGLSRSTASRHLACLAKQGYFKPRKVLLNSGQYMVIYEPTRKFIAIKSETILNRLRKDKSLKQLTKFTC